MQEYNQPVDALKDIRQMMEKSSRFISLSGWSGISAGCCALIAAIYTGSKIDCWKNGNCGDQYLVSDESGMLKSTLMTVGLVTFIAALILAFVFTYLRSKKTSVPIWGFTARRLLINLSIPLLAGGIFVIRLMQMGMFGLIAPTCLVFYGLALINSAKYTFGEIRYLGIGQLLLGIVNLWMIGYGLYFWAAGFGALHIIYGLVMWNKYERNS